jgi:hypothetical protein
MNFETTFSAGDIISLGTFMVIIGTIIYKLLIKVDKNKTMIGVQKEDMREVKLAQKELDTKIDKKVNEIYTNSNLKYAEIFTEISALRTELIELPLRIVTLINESKK